MKMLTSLKCWFQTDILILAGEYKCRPHGLAVTRELPADHTADTIDRYDKYIVFIIVHLSNNE